MTDTTAADGYSRALHRHYGDVRSRLWGKVPDKRVEVTTPPVVSSSEKRKANPVQDDIPPRPSRADCGEWRPVPSLPKYLVSDLGQVRHVDSSEPRKLNRNGAGYAGIGLWLCGVRSYECVHVLVAEAFIGPRPDGALIVFLDGENANCRASNLAYMTRRQAARHYKTFGRTLGRRPRKLDLEQRAEIVRRVEAGESCSRIATEFGVCRKTIGNIAREGQI